MADQTATSYHHDTTITTQVLAYAREERQTSVVFVVS